MVDTGCLVVIGRKLPRDWAAVKEKPAKFKLDTLWKVTNVTFAGMDNLISLDVSGNLLRTLGNHPLAPSSSFLKLKDILEKTLDFDAKTTFNRGSMPHFSSNYCLKKPGVESGMKRPICPHLFWIGEAGKRKRKEGEDGLKTWMTQAAPVFSTTRS